MENQITKGFSWITWITNICIEILTPSSHKKTLRRPCHARREPEKPLSGRRLKRALTAERGFARSPAGAPRPAPSRPESIRPPAAPPLRQRKRCANEPTFACVCVRTHIFIYIRYTHIHLKLALPFSSPCSNAQGQNTYLFSRKQQKGPFLCRCRWRTPTLEILSWKKYCKLFC